MTGGCLPTLIQLPIIYALYRVIQNIPAYIESIKAMYAPIAQAVLDTQGTKAQQFMVDFVKLTTFQRFFHEIDTFLQFMCNIFFIFIKSSNFKPLNHSDYLTTTFWPLTK